MVEDAIDGGTKCRHVRRLPRELFAVCSSVIRLRTQLTHTLWLQLERLPADVNLFEPRGLP
jgi:hypothetical protein